MHCSKPGYQRLWEPWSLVFRTYDDKIWQASRSSVWAVFWLCILLFALGSMIFDGLLRQLPGLSLSNFRRASVGKFFLERSSMDLFANFQNLPWAIFDAHRLGNFLGAIFDGLLRQLPNLPWTIINAHRLGNCLGRSSSTKARVFKDESGNWSDFPFSFLLKPIK